MSRYWSNLSFILQEFREGRVAKIRPLPAARAEFDQINRALAVWEPIVLAACEYYDMVVSDLPEATEKRDRLFAVIRKSGMVGKEEL